MKKTFGAAICAGTLFVMACNNENQKPQQPQVAVKKEENKANTSAENIIAFNVNKEAVVSFGWNISRFDFGNKVGTSLNITSGTDKRTHSINLNINGDKPGKYSLESKVKSTSTPGVAYGSYASDTRGDASNRFTFISGEFKIVSIDTIAGLLNATFFGSAKNAKGDIVTIKDGNVINGKMNPGVNKFK